MSFVGVYHFVCFGEEGGMFAFFPFGFVDGTWDLIVLVSNH